MSTRFPGSVSALRIALSSLQQGGDETAEEGEAGGGAEGDGVRLGRGAMEMKSASCLKDTRLLGAEKTYLAEADEPVAEALPEALPDAVPDAAMDMVTVEEEPADEDEPPLLEPALPRVPPVPAEPLGALLLDAEPAAFA